MKRIIRAVNSPDDDITVEMKSLFGKEPSATLDIYRHGAPCRLFSLREIDELRKAISEMKFAMDAERAVAV